jgi:hypothetical protein
MPELCALCSINQAPTNAESKCDDWHPDICGKCYALLTEGHCPKCGTEFNEAKKLDWVYDQGRGFCPWLWLTCKCGLKLTLDFGGLQSADIGHIDPGGN